VLDKNFKVIQLNSVAEELLGYTSQELIGTDLRSIIYCSYFDDRESSPFFENSDAFFTNLTSERFISTINKAGELVTVDVTINAYRFNTNKTIVLAARDVRVLLKQEEKLQLHSELFRKSLGNNLTKYESHWLISWELPIYYSNRVLLLAWICIWST
jgi:PAS domain S-box-containing protein